MLLFICRLLLLTICFVRFSCADDPEYSDTEPQEDSADQAFFDNQATDESSSADPLNQPALEQQDLATDATESGQNDNSEQPAQDASSQATSTSASQTTDATSTASGEQGDGGDPYLSSGAVGGYVGAGASLASGGIAGLIYFLSNRFKQEGEPGSLDNAKPYFPNFGQEHSAGAVNNSAIAERLGDSTIQPEPTQRTSQPAKDGPTPTVDSGTKTLAEEQAVTSDFERPTSSYRKKPYLATKTSVHD